MHYEQINMPALERTMYSNLNVPVAIFSQIFYKHDVRGV